MPGYGDNNAGSRKVLQPVGLDWGAAKMINDRIVLGTIAGLAGNAAKMMVDEVSVRLGISQRNYRSTAAGVWVSTHHEANCIQGQVLGTILDFGMGLLGGIGIVELLTLSGKDHHVGKGLVAGISFGSIITAFLSAFAQNKVRPKDAATNLSYLLTHAIYGVVTTEVAVRLGEPQLFVQKQPVAYLKSMVNVE